MEVLNRFVEVCLRKPAVVLKDCENSDFNQITLIELLYVPALLIASFITTVYLLLRNRNRNPASDQTFESSSLGIVSESGDFNLMDVEPPPELYWEYEEDYPSPY